LQVEILQNPGKVVRGYASINELNTKLKQALKEIDELKKNIKEDVPFVS
jgi:peptidoglycan hydrolase CwlO-like protein